MKQPASSWLIQHDSCMDWNRISSGFSPGSHRLWRAGRRKSFDLSGLTIPKFSLLFSTIFPFRSFLVRVKIAVELLK